MCNSDSRYNGDDREGIGCIRWVVFSVIIALIIAVFAIAYLLDDQKAMTRENDLPTLSLPSLDKEDD